MKLPLWTKTENQRLRAANAEIGDLPGFPTVAEYTRAAGIYAKFNLGWCADFMGSMALVEYQAQHDRRMMEKRGI